MKFLLRVLCAFAVMALFSCRTAGPLSVITQTKLGQPVTMTEPQRTGNRKNIPAGVKPKDIAAHVKTKSGAETWVTKEGDVYQNAQAQKENAAPPDVPRRPWYHYIVWILAFVAAGACVLFCFHLCARFTLLKRFIKGR